MVGLPRRLAAGMAIAGLAATILACGSSASTSPQSVASTSPSPVPTLTASATVTPTRGVSGAIDACTLLTDQEAAQVVGAAVTHAASNNPGTRACAYTTGPAPAATAAGPRIALPVGSSLAVDVIVSPSAAAARAAVTTQSQGFFAPGRLNPETALPSLGDGGVVIVELPGLADIPFCKGVAFVSIHVNYGATTAGALEAAAQAVLTRL